MVHSRSLGLQMQALYCSSLNSYPNIGVLHFNTFVVPGFLLQQLIPKKSIPFFFWCVLQTRVSILIKKRPYSSLSAPTLGKSGMSRKTPFTVESYDELVWGLYRLSVGTSGKGFHPCRSKGLVPLCGENGIRRFRNPVG